MKRIVFFIILIIALSLSEMLFAQQSDTMNVRLIDRPVKTIMKKNAVYLAFGSVASSQTRDFSPVLDVYYVRTLWKGLGIGAGYSFYDYDMKWHMEEPSRPESYTYKTDVFSHTIFLELSWSFLFAKFFSITPFFRAGYAFQTLNIQYIANPKIAKVRESNFSFTPGLSFSYTYHSLSIGISYNYAFPQFAFYSPFFDCEARPNRGFNLNHHEVKVGVGYRF